MKLFNLLRYLIEAIAGALFGPDSHSEGRYVWVTTKDPRIREGHAPATDFPDIKPPVEIIDNPNRKWWQFWKPKTVTVSFLDLNCRCNINPLEEPADD